MKRLLILVLLSFPFYSHANFSGMSFTDSPLGSIESIIDDVIRDSKLGEVMANQPTDLKNIKKALLRGSTKDNDTLRNLVKTKNMLPTIKDLPIEEQDKEYTINQVFIKHIAEEFGYKELNQ